MALSKTRSLILLCLVCTVSPAAADHGRFQHERVRAQQALGRLPGSSTLVVRWSPLLKDRGMMGCVRLKDHVDFEGKSGLAYPDSMAGTFPDGTPGYMQFRVAVQDATKELTIEYVPAGGSFMGIPLGGVKGDVWVALST